MRTSYLETDPLAVDLVLSPDAFRVVPDDGRELPVPLARFPRLSRGTPEQLRNRDLTGRGEGLHREDLDEDISVAGLSAGRGDQAHGRSRAA